MCCSLGHTCTCAEVETIQVLCHTCNRLIDSDDYAHIDKHIDAAEDVICSQCHISIPNIPDWYGLCRSCIQDNKRDKDN